MGVGEGGGERGSRGLVEEDRGRGEEMRWGCGVGEENVEVGGGGGEGGGRGGGERYAF